MISCFTARDMAGAMLASIRVTMAVKIFNGFVGYGTMYSSRRCLVPLNNVQFKLVK
jgi:hypothetical protein